LNYAEPTDIAKIVQSVLTAEIGQVATDDRSRQIIVTDIPIVIEQVAQLITDVDLPVKQVAIEAMVVDAVLADSAQTGTEWIAEAIRRESRRGEVIGNLSELALDTELGIGDDAVGTLTFGIISSELNVQATISAEVSNGNAKLLTNPQVVTIENQLAKISIAQEIPYREIRQSEAGGSQTTTSFKEVGTILEVTPRVTHEDDVIVKIEVKQSDTKGEFEGIPIEDKREAGTTLRARDGQTIFIGGLRKFDDTRDVRKVPFLGDIPVANFLFRSNVNRTEINELMIFLTCHVLQEHVPDLTPYQQMKYDELGGTPLVPTTERDVMGNIVHPGRVREPFWKWRRNK
jgi:type IV pilus assembly protein PilQ